MGFVETDRAKGQNGFHQRIHVTRGGNVYDVTDFAKRHPGGRELLLKHNGQDIEDIMQSQDSHVHSKAAYTILDKYYVGPESALREEVRQYSRKYCKI